MFNRVTVVSIALSVMLAAPALADGDLAKQSQNPIGNMISLPLQNNTYFGVGPAEEWANSFQAQPVLPVNFGKVNLINRAIIPYTYIAAQEGTVSESGLLGNETLTLERDSVSGLGNITYQGFISPAKPGKIIWGVGPSFLFPSATEDSWASEKWSGGAGVVVLTMPGSWVLGVLLQNVWSFAGDDDAESVNLMTLQPIINYNLNKGWYLTSVPVITANWTASSSNRWTVPLGGGFGRIVKWGKQPLDLSMQAFYNVEKPKPRIADAPNLQNQGETWTLRLQLKLLFPK